MKNYRIYILFGCLCAALLYNGYVHLNTPAYKYYKEEFSKFREEMEDYKKKINEGLISSLVEVYSNSVSSVSSSPSAASAGTNDRPKKIGAISAQPGFANGKYCFKFNDFIFKVGDTFFDSVILSIDPTCLWTEYGYYVFTPPDTEGLSEQKEKDKKKDKEQEENG